MKLPENPENCSERGTNILFVTSNGKTNVPPESGRTVYFYQLEVDLLIVA